MAKRPPDPNQLAKLIVDIAAGAAEDAISEEKKNPKPKRGQAGGLKGGASRAKTRVYMDAVEDAFGADVDYAQLQKIYGAVVESETRYSPAQCSGCDMKVVSGDPDPKHVSTSFVERQNLTMRMGMRRFTRLTNAFSKKVENHAAMVAIHFLHYNFGRIHKTLRVTPAMATGLADHVWSLEEIIGLLD